MPCKTISNNSNYCYSYYYGSEAGEMYLAQSVLILSILKMRKQGVGMPLA